MIDESRGRRLLGTVAVIASIAMLAASDRRDVGPWPEVGTAVPLAVRDGTARFRVPCPEAGTKTLVIVSNLARSGNSVPIRVSGRSVDGPTAPNLCDDGPIKPPIALPLLAKSVEKTRGTPPPERLFHLPVRDGDASSPSNYAAVRGRLRGWGDHVQVYVDEADLGRVGPETLGDVIGTFDHAIYPRMLATLGEPRDVDGDGRVTILISGWLGHLADGKLAVDGFVRGADFDLDLAAPLGNRCDLICLNAALTAGPHLRTVIAHEYTHAVTLRAHASTRPEVDEEGWLDEAIAHLGEDLHGFSRTNLDHRISAFLANPGRFRLLVSDYSDPDLIRSHGHRGGAYLFLRWCADRFGSGLLPRLARSDRTGVANLEAATGASFERLFRDWTVSLATSGDGPRPETLSADGPVLAFLAEPTTVRYVVVESNRPGAVEVEVSAPRDAKLQVTAIRLASDLPHLTLDASSEEASDGQVALRARVRLKDDRPVRFVELQWSPLHAPTDPSEARRESGKLSASEVSGLLGHCGLDRRGSVTSSAIPIVGRGAKAVRLVAEDAQGRRVVAWSVTDEPTASRVAASR